MNNNSFWDPVEHTISEGFFGKQLSNFKNNILSYKKNPYKQWIYISIWLIPPVITFLILLNNDIINFDTLTIVYFTALPLIIYIYTVVNMQKAATPILLSEQNNWLYYPFSFYTKARYEKLQRLFPEIFHPSLKVFSEDNIWGKYNDFPFWAFNFYLKQDTGKLRHSYNVSAIVIKFPKKISIPFTLLSSRAFTLGNTAKFELEELNNIFKIKPAEKNYNKLDLMNILNPSAQILLTEFAEQVPIWKIIFREDMMLVQTNDQIIHSKFISFYKGIIIDKEVKNSVENFIQNVGKFSNTFYKFIR